MCPSSKIKSPTSLIIDGSFRRAKSSFSGVATTMSRWRIASSSIPLTPMLPYSIDIVFPSGPNVLERVASVCAESARSGVMKTTRLPPARQRRIHNSAIRVFPALVGNETTKSSLSLTERPAASLRWPEINFGSRSSLKQCNKQFPKRGPFSSVTTNWNQWQSFMECI